MIDTRTIQAELAKAGLYTGDLDGQTGPQTRAAVTKYLELNFRDVSWSDWPPARRLVAVQQLMLKKLGFHVGAVDGLVGPQTSYSIEQWQNHMRAVPGLPPIVPEAKQWPLQSETSMNRFYGARGSNQVSLVSPYPLRLAWDLNTAITKFSINEKCHDAAKNAMKKVLKVYGADEIRRLRLDVFGGCLNVRKMRGGNAWSIHSWGAAIDFDPDHNQLRWGKDRASFAKPAYQPFWDAWLEQGAVSLGLERNYDWMHVQFARL